MAKTHKMELCADIRNKLPCLDELTLEAIDATINKFIDEKREARILEAIAQLDL